MFYRFARALKDDQKGFTLVELMVVVVIIGILVAIAVPVYNNVQTDAQDKADQATARTILSAVTMAMASDSTADPLDPTADEINAFLNNPKIVKGTTGDWSVNKNADGEWEVYKDGTKIILP